MEEITIQEFLLRMEAGDVSPLQVWNYDVAFVSVMLMTNLSMYYLNFEEGLALEVLNGENTAYL